MKNTRLLSIQDYSPQNRRYASFKDISIFVNIAHIHAKYIGSKTSCPLIFNALILTQEDTGNLEN